MTAERAVLRLPQVLPLVGLSKSTLYHYVQHGLFPAPLKLGIRASGWLAEEVNQWVAERAKERQGIHRCV